MDEIGKENIFYQDESGFDEYFTRRNGWEKIGKTLELVISGKKYARKSIISIRNWEHKLVEPFIYDGTGNSGLVLNYFTHLFTKITKRSVFILDNASYHKSQKLKELFEKHGHVMLFLPPYSPDLNPIEKLWGNLKRQLRN